MINVSTVVKKTSVATKDREKYHNSAQKTSKPLELLFRIEQHLDKIIKILFLSLDQRICCRPPDKSAYWK